MIQQKEKQCKGPCGEMKFIYARRMCKPCDIIMTPEKHGSTLKRTPLKPSKKSSISYKPKGPSGQYDLFLNIWQDREHVSFLSGKNLDQWWDTDLFVHLFAHVLPKGRYRTLKLKEWNIKLLTPDEHHLFDAGTADQREKYAKENNCDWTDLFELKETFKREHYAKTKIDFHAGKFDKPK